LKLPAEKNTYCPTCGKHTTHINEKVRSKPRGELSKGQRRHRRRLKGYGSQPKSMAKGTKPTQKHDLRYVCKECGKAHSRPGFRAKRLEIVKS